MVACRAGMCFWVVLGRAGTGPKCVPTTPSLANHDADGGHGWYGAGDSNFGREH